MKLIHSIQAFPGLLRIASVGGQYVGLALAFFSLQALVYALFLVAEYHHAFQALNAFVVINSSVFANGVNAAGVLAMLARGAAQFHPVQPAEQPQPADDRQSGAQWA